MGRSLKAFARDVGPVVAEKKLFLGAFTRIVSGAWFQFYSVENERMTLWDVILFDIIEGSFFDQKEICNPQTLKCVVDLNSDRKGIQGRRLFTFNTQDGDGTLSYGAYFADAAFHRRTLTIHRSKDSS